MSEQCLVLLGERGVGKSSLPQTLAYIVGKDDEQYYNKFDNIEDLTCRFNADMMTSIITAIEELPQTAGTFHNIQSKLKSIVTEKNMTYEQKNVAKFKGKSNNNFILMTNEMNPVQIHEDNRRFIIVKVNNAEKQRKAEYFVPLRKEINEKIEEIRYFFNTFEFIDDINSIRPLTQAEKQLRELNEDITERFIKEALILNGPKTDSKRLLKNVYTIYTDYCKEESKKPLPKNFFKVKLEDKGYNSILANHKQIYIQCFTENGEYIIDDENSEVSFAAETDVSEDLTEGSEDFSGDRPLITRKEKLDKLEKGKSQSN